LCGPGVEHASPPFPTRRSSDLFVGTYDERMRAVFAGTIHRAEKLDLVELVVSVRIADPPETGAIAVFVDHYVQTVERVEQAVRTDRKSTRLNSSHVKSSYAVLC